MSLQDLMILNEKIEELEELVEKQAKIIAKMKEFLTLIERLSKIKTYNSCNVFKGVMIRDSEACYLLIKEARELIKRLKQVEEIENE